MERRDLVRNVIALGGGVIYTLDIRDQLPKQQWAFPQRRFQTYRRDIANPRGSVEPLAAGNRPRTAGLAGVSGSAPRHK